MTLDVASSTAKPVSSSSITMSSPAIQAEGEATEAGAIDAKIQAALQRTVDGVDRLFESIS
jgi:hypothetical protein